MVLTSRSPLLLMHHPIQDLVEVLSKPFLVPKRVDQTLLYKNEDGQLEFEEVSNEPAGASR